jgi:hypothetical protein
MNRSSLGRLAAAAFIAMPLVLLLTIGRWFPAAHTPQPSAASPAARLRSAACRQCHAAVWQEWHDSLHAQAFVHPYVQAAFQHFGHDRQCQSCHAAEPVLADLAAPVALRDADRESGVDCLVCHALADGRIAARRTNSAAPCRPVASETLVASLHCGRCHRAIHDDWQASRLAGTQENCQHCHMPPTDARPGGRSHRCLGGHDEALVRSAAEFTARWEGDQIFVSVLNRRAGHNFPGERHNRILLVQVIERSADGEIARAEQRLIKGITPFRGESSSEQIRFEERFEAAFPAPAPANQATVQLLYKLFPWYADRDALVVAQRELARP